MSVDGPMLAERARRLRDLHDGGEPLVLPNVWDVASALAVERAGARAIATTSSGLAASLGYPDGEVIPVDEMLTMVERIAAAVAVPVTADLESGYGLDPETLVEALLATGAVGMNLEDSDRSGDGSGLVDLDRHVEWLAAVRHAAEELGVPIVINARIDVFLRGDGSHAEQVAEAIRRGRAYAAAGADCVYPIFLSEADAIGRMVGEVDAAVNALLRPGSPSLRELRALGVRRISVGGGLALHAMTFTESLARRLLNGDDVPFSEIGET